MKKLFFLLLMLSSNAFAQITMVDSNIRGEGMALPGTDHLQIINPSAGDWPIIPSQRAALIICKAAKKNTVVTVTTEIYEHYNFDRAASFENGYYELVDLKGPDIFIKSVVCK